MEYNIIIIVVIIIYLLITSNLWIEKGVKFMSFIELIEYNLKLALINNAGITYLHKNGSKILELCTADPILIKMHRELNKKYGKLVLTYIVTKSKNYYILDASLAKKILYDSPELFEAGKIKEDFFKTFMPYNLGISKCPKITNCPWKKRRTFNEKVLGTNKINPFFLCIQDIIEKNIKNPLLNIDDFKQISFKIVSDIIYGSNGENTKLLKQFVKETNMGTNIMKSDFYKKYIRHLHKSYKTAPECSLLYFANMYKNDNLEIIDNQIPHWFGPFIFMISFLIPTLLCIILNYKDVYNKLINEISNDYFDIYSKESYLHYCVIEHIRLFNTININIQRTVNKDMNFDGINFTKDDQIFILFSSILRNEKEFKNPDQFIPDRWVTQKIENQNIVFGVGPQQCPSKQISPFLYKIIIRHLLLSFNYSNVTPKLYNKDIYFINPYDIRFSI